MTDQEQCRNAQLHILCLEVVGGRIQPIAWSKGKLSKRVQRRHAKRFMKDADVVGFKSVKWSLYFNTTQEAKHVLPQV